MPESSCLTPEMTPPEQQLPPSPAAGLFHNERMRRLALWWFRANSLGVVLSIFIERGVFYEKVRAHTRNAPQIGTEVIFIILWLPFMAALGGLQVWACCWLISLIKVQSRIFQVALGIILRILAAVGVSILGMLIFYYHALIGFYSFLLSGIVFGSLVGHAQWLLVTQKRPYIRPA